MMKLLSGCNKKATARATSPGSPILPRGCILRLAFSEVSLFHNFSVRGVLVCRGQTSMAQLYWLTQPHGKGHLQQLSLLDHNLQEQSSATLTRPGATALTLMLWLAYVLAAPIIRPDTAPLAAAMPSCW